MKLIFLGTGCITPQAKRKPSSCLLLHKNIKGLIDMGPGVYLSLAKYLKNPFDLDFICLTHFHQDHLSDLWPFLFGRHYSGDFYSTLKEITIFAESRFEQVWEGQKLSGNSWLNEIKGVELKLLETNDETEFGDIRIRTHQMNHRPESLGYEFFFKVKKIAFSGDSGYSDNLIKLFSQADVGVIECSLDNSRSADHHLSPEKLGNLFRILASNNCMPKHWYLTHFYPGVADSPDIQNLIKKFPRVTVAYDALEIEI